MDSCYRAVEITPIINGFILAVTKADGVVEKYAYHSRRTLMQAVSRLLAAKEQP